MSYKSLLFCPDETSARLVTRVLSELEFTVELASETYATVKKLNDEHFDALVVDCQNEQDAALLFKTAKNSSQNHTSLTVAVVEGQAGVAKAFRIGANLVLTKPINVEQSKGTLRVARGLLKKSQPKPAGETAGTSFLQPVFSAPRPMTVTPAPASAFGASASAFSAAAAAPAPEKPHNEVPYAGLELEKEALPVPEAGDAAVLDSLPELPSAPVTPTAAPALISRAASAPDFAGLSGGSAAAAAPALEKKTIDLHAAGAAPQFTNEPIVKDAGAPEVFATPAPTFSSLESRSTSEGGGKGFLKIAAVFLLLALGFFGWRKLQSMRHAPDSASENAAQESAPQQTKTQTPQNPAQTQTVSPAIGSSSGVSDQTATKNSAEEEVSAIPASRAQHNADADSIEIQEMPFSRDSKVTVTPRPQPLVVKAGAAKQPVQVSTPVAPSLDVAANSSTATIANLMPADAPLPKPAPGTIRISQGVSQGLLLKKAAPSYPAMALQLHKEGTVELLATVSREGRITNIKTLSGDPMLVKSATDAVRQWQYRPYLLNGQPFEVETQISVSFKLPR